MSREWGHLCETAVFQRLSCCSTEKMRVSPSVPGPQPSHCPRGVSGVLRTLGPAPVPCFEVGQSLLGPHDPLGVALPEQPAALWGSERGP